MLNPIVAQPNPLTQLATLERLGLDRAKYSRQLECAQARLTIAESNRWQPEQADWVEDHLHHLAEQEYWNAKAEVSRLSSIVSNIDKEMGNV